MQVEHVENLPAELQAVAFEGQLPALVQSHIQAGVAVASDHISRTSLTGKRMNEVVGECGRWVGENTDRAIRLFEVPGRWAGNHLRNSLLVPIGGPEIP